MTPKQRMLAVMKGEKPDEVPFVEYAGMIPRGAEEIWRHVDIKDVGGLAWVGAWDTETPNCRMESVETEEDGQDVIRGEMGTGPVFMPLLSVREEHVRRIGASLSDLVGCAAYGHSRGAFINGACPRICRICILSPYIRYALHFLLSLSFSLDYAVNDRAGGRVLTINGGQLAVVASRFPCR